MTDGSMTDNMASMANDDPNVVSQHLAADEEIHPEPEDELASESRLHLAPSDEVSPHEDLPLADAPLPSPEEGHALQEGAAEALPDEARGISPNEDMASRRISESTDELQLRALDLDIPTEAMGDVTLCSSSSGTISQEGEDFGHRRQSAHVAASARALMASDARSAAQAAVDSAEINLKGPRFRTASNSTTGTRRRAEEYLAAPPVSGVRDDVRRKAPVTSQAAGGSAQGARAWYQGLARQKAEVEASVQDYRKLLLKSLKTLSQVKSALYDADERSMHLTKGAEVILPEVWDVINSLLQGDLAEAALMQTKAEEDARTHQDLKAKLRVSSAALEVEAALTSCDELRSRIEEVQSRLGEIRGGSVTQRSGDAKSRISKAEAHGLIRSFTAILLPQLPELVKSDTARTASEATTIHFLQAASQQSAATPGARPGGSPGSRLAQARAARGGKA